MRAVVQKVNYKRGFVAYETEDYDYGWLEILDTVDLEIEDELEGPFTDLGEAIICKKVPGSLFMYLLRTMECLRKRHLKWL